MFPMIDDDHNVDDDDDEKFFFVFCFFWQYRKTMTMTFFHMKNLSPTHTYINRAIGKKKKLSNQHSDFVHMCSKVIE